MSVVDCGAGVLFIAVLRLSDRELVASYLSQTKDVSRPEYIKLILSFANSTSPPRVAALEGNYHVGLHRRQDGDLAFYCVTANDYPSRVAELLLQQIAETYRSNGFVPKSLSCKPEGMTKKAWTVLKCIVDDFQDPTTKDKLLLANEKVRIVKSEMVQNCEQLAALQEKTEVVLDMSNNLESHSGAFEKKTDEIRREENWKNRKWTMILAFVALLLLVLICFSLYLQFNK